ncbi:hypothetical protein JCM19992_02440 [Thermostilla marina]
MRVRRLLLAGVAAAWCLLYSPVWATEAKLSGELKKWHCVTLSVEGPQASETGDPNPFRDYRMEVLFTHGDREIVVPGFFAADGNAAETSATEGNCWQARFTPDAEGEWTYHVRFRAGTNVAISDDPHAGKAISPDGLEGSFRIGPSDKQAPDFRATGMLQYVGERYLKFAETGTYFLKCGADSPENFLAYYEFDGQPSEVAVARKRREGEARSTRPHRYQPHVADWQPGDPTWQGGKGKGIIGGLNYLASAGVNSVYFLTMNVAGDGNDVWPWVDPDTRDRFDVSKLDQWEIVFSHMTAKGIQLHVILQETENDQLLDGGALGELRKLYLRELIARFAHHPALMWNLGEENTNTDAQRKEFAEYIVSLDPWDHPVVVHTFPNKQEEVYRPLLGFPYLHGVSLQLPPERTHEETKKWVLESTKAGHRWVVDLDEIGPADTGVKPDADDPTHDFVRSRVLWANLCGGGGGCEWYFGYKYAHNDLNCEDWRSRANMWKQTRLAVDFFQEYVPFHEMLPADELIGDADAYCFASPGKVYVVYMPPGSGEIEIRLADGRYTVAWFNPREGGGLQQGSVPAVTGPGPRALGMPPRDPKADWVVLLRREH